ncbi:MAG: LysM peptidoglycan-binding domain-containing protein [Bacteroidetes bacterium]|jgi:membrane-bound lytic murein transglycosylase D|nr:LysM peptidoglycan-binding domain-containing protein [Bacteroidota bacterium]
MRLRVFSIFLSLSGLVYGQTGVTATRLSQINSTIELSYNGYVEQAISDLVSNKDNKTGELLGKSANYLPEIEDSLEAHQLPHELQYLIPTVSQYNNWKVSDDGGSGYWQLRYVMAKRYGLKISSYIDERRDYRKATSAAIPYFKKLYEELGDWHAVIAAFVSDKVEVNKAIRMAGGKTDYWEYHRFLPLKYQYVVPGFIAQIYTHSYFEPHNITVDNVAVPKLETVTIDQWVTIYQLSKALDVKYDDLKEYNAIYKKQVIPNTDKVYEVKIPFERVGRYYELGDSIYTYQSHEIPTGSVEPRVNKDTPSVKEPAVVKPPVKTGPRLMYYTVRKGDYLGRIADLYDVRISDVRKWNKIKGDRININQRVKIYKPSSQYTKYNKINSMSTYQKNQLIKKD